MVLLYILGLLIIAYLDLDCTFSYVFFIFLSPSPLIISSRLKSLNEIHVLYVFFICPFNRPLLFQETLATKEKVMTSCKIKMEKIQKLVKVKMRMKMEMEMIQRILKNIKKCGVLF